MTHLKLICRNRTAAQKVVSFTGRPSPKATRRLLETFTGKVTSYPPTHPSRRKKVTLGQKVVKGGFCPPVFPVTGRQKTDAPLQRNKRTPGIRGRNWDPLKRYHKNTIYIHPLLFRTEKQSPETEFIIDEGDGFNAGVKVGAGEAGWGDELIRCSLRFSIFNWTLSMAHFAWAISPENGRISFLPLCLLTQLHHKTSSSSTLYGYHTEFHVDAANWWPRSDISKSPTQHSPENTWTIDTVTSQNLVPIQCVHWMGTRNFM